MEAADAADMTWEQKEAQRAASHLEWQQQQWQQQQDKLRQRDQKAMSPRVSPRSSPRLPDPSELYSLPTTQVPSSWAVSPTFCGVPLLLNDEVFSLYFLIHELATSLPLHLS